MGLEGLEVFDSYCTECAPTDSQLSPVLWYCGWCSNTRITSSSAAGFQPFLASCIFMDLTVTCNLAWYKFEHMFNLINVIKMFHVIFLDVY
jgi:hypothetical protein